MAQFLVHSVFPQNRGAGDGIDRLAHELMDGAPILSRQQRQIIQTFCAAHPTFVDVFPDLRDLIQLPQLFLLAWSQLQRRQDRRQMLLGGHPLPVQELKEAGTVDLGLLYDLIFRFPTEFDGLT